MFSLFSTPISHQHNKPNRSHIFAFGLMLLLNSLSGCQNYIVQPTKASLVVFGTLVEIVIYDDNRQKAEKAISQVEQKFQHMHDEWHAWEKGGIVSKINQAISNNQAIVVPKSVQDFIIKSQTLTQQSQGLFDPGIGSLIALWGFHSKEWQGPPPSEAKIANWLQSKPSILDISIQNNQLISSNKNVQLDFGGNAKGLAIDIALETIKNAGIKNALVSIGGDMKAMGLKNGQAWSIGIQSPENPAKALAQVFLNGNESIVTSGIYQRYFDWQGKRYSHILNPTTGYPANSFSSVTVIHKDATTADAAATAILIAGPKRWLEVAKSMNISQVICIDHNGKILQTKAMAKRIKLL
jgi:thiamine biosynthesis lipoprotein